MMYLYCLLQFMAETADVVWCVRFVFDNSWLKKLMNLCIVYFVMYGT